MDRGIFVGLGVAAIFGFLPYAVKDMPRWVAFFGIALGIILVVADLIPVVAQHLRGPTLLYAVGAVCLISGGFWQYSQTREVPSSGIPEATVPPLAAAPAPTLISPRTNIPNSVAIVPRNRKDVRRVQDALEEIYEFLNTQDAALQNDLSNFEKFRMFLITNRGKAYALDTVDSDAKNIAKLYSEVIGGFPKRFRTDWTELSPLLEGAEETIAPLSNSITGYRSALAQINEPPSLEDADNLLNAVKPVQQTIPAFREWLNLSLQRCGAMKIELAKAALSAD